MVDINVKNKVGLLLITTTVLLTSCNTVVDDPNLRIEDKGGDFVIKDGLPFKQKTQPDNILLNDNLSQVLRRMDQEKVDGLWDSEGNFLLTDGDLNVGLSPITFTGEGLMSIPVETKNKFRVNTPVYNEKIKASGLSFSSAIAKFPNTTKSANDNLCNSFDLRSPGTFLGPEEWINVVKRYKGGSKGKVLPYHEYGKLVHRHQEEQLTILVNSVYKASMDQAAKGKTVNPDFLIALSIHETGWGNNKFSRDRNSWFSYNAVNSNPDLAKGYDTPYDSVMDIIDRLWDNYLNPGGSYHIEDKGATLFGINTYYAKEDGYNYPNYEWSVNIARIMRMAFKLNNYNPPNF